MPRPLGFRESSDRNTRPVEPGIELFPGWKWDETCTFTHGPRKPGAKFVFVISTGYLSEVDGARRIVEEVSKFDASAEIMVFSIPHEDLDADQIARDRAEQIAKFANGRPVAMMGHSAGGAFSALVAERLLKSKVRVLGVAFDSSYTNMRSFATSMRDAVRTVVVEADARAAVRNFSAIAQHPLQELRTGRFCHSLNSDNALGFLGRRKVPMFFFRGSLDKLVRRSNTAHQIAACGDNAIVASIETPFGHQRFSYPGRSHRILVQRFLEACEELLDTKRNSREVFRELEDTVIDDARVLDLNFVRFEVDHSRLVAEPDRQLALPTPGRSLVSP